MGGQGNANNRRGRLAWVGLVWFGLGWLWYGHGDRDMAFTIYLLHILKKNNVVSVQVQFISVLVLVPIITSCIHNI